MISVVLLDTMGSDLTVANAARVSFAKRSEALTERDEGLIRYLAKHRHWTPFGHCFASFHIKAPIFVARQLARHSVGLCWNEVSRRYVDDPPEFYLPAVWRPRPVNKKQGSGEGSVDVDSPSAFLVSAVCRSAYDKLIEAGVAPEQARMVLPQNTMTEWWWSGSLAAFARVCGLRLQEDAQAETREVASLIDTILAGRFPVSWAALREAA